MMRNFFDDLMEGFDALDAELEGRLTLRQHVVEAQAQLEANLPCRETDLLKELAIQKAIADGKVTNGQFGQKSPPGKPSDDPKKL